MEESAQRSHCRECGPRPRCRHRPSLPSRHGHPCARAVRRRAVKEGASTSVTMVSALTGRVVRGDLARTGEITVSGQVLPIAIKEKVLAPAPDARHGVCRRRPLPRPTSEVKVFPLCTPMRARDRTSRRWPVMPCCDSTTSQPEHRTPFARRSAATTC